MKAFIIAAGLGTRLRPLTNTVPKCMIDIGNHPLLWYHVMSLKTSGITDIWINTHWLADQVTSFFGDGSQFGVHISYSHEPELLGTSGAVVNPVSGIKEDLSKGPFIVSYGDNFTNFNFRSLIDFHNQKKPLLTIVVNHSDEPWTKGVIETDPSSRITRMVEKPPKEDIRSDLTNAGMYLCEPEIINHIPSGFSDFAADIFPQLISARLPLYALTMSEYLQDTGTPQRYTKAQVDFPSLNFPFKL